ncbi:unnamed protein product [Adineta steineri]|uniref:Glycosyl hydrolase family 13 catalytic domain-containing protein n=1 Tax=Adineta steineri TaxID=433720 RepID=A0A813M7J7_9BILA|nr:unnamed protein product [Adineta steineri]
MVQASHVDESTDEFKTKDNSPPSWLKRARIIAALIYIFLQTAYFIFIIVCIAVYPRCQQAAETPWWLNSVFLRFSTPTMKFNDLNEKLTDYKNNFSMQTIWLSSILPLSNELNPLTWTDIDATLGNNNTLINLIDKAHENNIRIIVDYPLNHLSIQSSYFISNDDDYFVWNEQGNTSNWMTIDNNQESAWTFNNRKNSFYLHQFYDNHDSIDINYRNNRVLNDTINSFSYWNKNFQFDGFNLQGISYTYEDYEYRNETDNIKRTRHLDEDYLLLARIRTEIDKEKILLLDSIDSLSTTNDELLTRYYGDKNGYLGGVQLASLNNFILIDEFQTNITMLFNNYYNSIFIKQDQPFLWSSLSINSKLNEAFFAACLFHKGAISIDINKQGEQFTNDQLGRLRQITTFAQTLDVFRVGNIQQNILPNSQFLTIERTRRGARHHMIIINFSNIEQEDTIELKDGVTNAVEVLVTNILDSGTKYETNALIDMTKSIRLKPYEYLIIRWSPSIDGLGVIF